MNRELAAHGPAYLYELVADDLARRIESGELAVNQPLPAEQVLARQYGIALGTCRHATRILRERGLVRTIPSKGTFVVGRPRRTPVYCFDQLLGVA
ncbi:GntR family transcriptional regulator [Amycolatopsis granulosa]|uniref:GntR family transcriptional regulator n=1 Tax=Amycolatopsis granulosa TaxID=185684 RepID=UPI001424A034|nr:DNA-binding GntR family transcriptional regulator [Amycolatopsis granulosa]